MAKKCEVGNIYIGADRRHYLAISNNKLITAYRGNIRRFSHKTTYKIVRISVEELCEIWSISLDQLDEITLKVLPMVKPGEMKGKGSRRGQNPEAAVAAWKELRMARMPS